MFEEAKEKLKRTKLVPVIKLDSVEDALPLGSALRAGGLLAAEVTFRTDAAEESIQRLVKEYPEIMVGAGTVVNLEQAKKAVDAGVKFIVSPGLNRGVIEYSVDQKIPIYPGICTPSELMMALEYNLSVVKFFPAKQYGGLNTIKALAAPFPHMQFMPTGGIDISNILEYLACPSVIACGGSWMVQDALIKGKEFSKIESLVREAVALVESKE